MSATALVGWLLLDVTVVVLAEIGPCTVDVIPIEYFDFNEFASHNDGIWPYRMVPDVEQYQNLTWAFQSYNPIASQDVYTVRVYRQMGCEGPSEWNHVIRFDVDQEGIIVGKQEHRTVVSSERSPVDTYRFTILAYEPGRYVYFYACSQLGTDSEADYRFVLGECLCEEEKAKILEIDQSYQFKGCLREL